MDTKLTLASPIFHDETKAREYLESVRWPNGPICPHCGNADKVYQLQGKSTRAGVRKCGACRKPFTVTVGTVFERSKIPLHKWLLASFLISSSKKGYSAHQLHRTLGITYKTAWFMAHRIRHAVAPTGARPKFAGIVETDETYIGPRRVQGKPGRGAAKKTPIVSLIQGDGNSRSFVVDDVKGATLKGLIRANVECSAHVTTDSFPSYRGLDKEFASHGTVDHSKEYVRGIIHVNFAESYFSMLKR